MKISWVAPDVDVTVAELLGQRYPGQRVWLELESGDQHISPPALGCRTGQVEPVAERRGKSPGRLRSCACGRVHMGSKSPNPGLLDLRSR